MFHLSIGKQIKPLKERRGRLFPHAGSGPAAQAILEPETPDHPEGFPDDLPRHFGAAQKAIRENDRHLGDLHSLHPDLVVELDLEAVAVGPDAIEMDGAEGAPAE